MLTTEEIFKLVIMIIKMKVISMTRNELPTNNQQICEQICPYSVMGPCTVCNNGRPHRMYAELRHGGLCMAWQGSCTLMRGAPSAIQIRGAPL